MKKDKKARLESAGWKVGSAAEFLELDPCEAAYIEIKLALARILKSRRLENGLTQAALADRTGSSQSRVAKMEAADPTVSIDLLVRSLLASGASPHDIAQAVRLDSPPHNFLPEHCP